MDPITVTVQLWQVVLGICGGIAAVAPVAAWLMWAAVRPRVEATMGQMLSEEQEARETAISAADRHCAELRGQCGQVRTATEAAAQASVARLSSTVDRLVVTTSELTVQVARLAGELQAARRAQ